jgi:hypothetical protein
MREYATALGTVLLALVLAACTGSGRPIGLAAQRNSTIFIPVGSEIPEHRLGYDGDISLPDFNRDHQRGKLLFYLIRWEASTNPTNPWCGDGYDDFTEGSCHRFQLTTRVVVRVLPDPASNAGILNNLDGNSLVGEALAAVDIPNDPAITPGAYGLFVRRHMHVLPGGGSDPNDPNVPKETPALFGDLETPTKFGIFTILDGVGQPTPSDGLSPAGSSSVFYQLQDLVPYPSVILNFAAPGFMDTRTPAAAEIELTYPKTKVQILSVFEWLNLGRKTLIRWSDDPVAGKVKIHFVDPDRSVYGLQVAFRLINPTGLGRVKAADFSLQPHPQTKAYKLDGFSPPEQAGSPVVWLGSEIR